AIMGRSFGGYWAAKMAFVEAKRLRAAVVWGGGVHYFFQEDWLPQPSDYDASHMCYNSRNVVEFTSRTVRRPDSMPFDLST
ncbi:MAG: hypothetical protein ACREQ7_00680, partial [Candidatus Binatia bacterium]